MKKKILLSLLVLVTMVTFVGCTKKEEINDNQLIGDLVDKLNCSELKNIKISNPKDYPEDDANGGFLTDSGDYYYFGKFSDGTNCKKVLIDNAIVKLSAEGDLYFIDTDNKIYQFNNKNVKEIDFYDDLKSRAWRVENIREDNNAIKSYGGPASVVAQYVLRNDGIIYLIDYENKELDKVSFDNEKILDFSTNNNELNWIKTDKAHYMRKLKDKNCYKYDDIDCQYEFVKDNDLTNIYDDVAFVERNKAVLKDGICYILNY